MAREIAFVAVAAVLGAYSISALAASKSEPMGASFLHNSSVQAGVPNLGLDAQSGTEKFCIEQVCKPRRPKAIHF